jgi:Mce-associated membrane protein
MTSPPGEPADKPSEPEKESDAVSVNTDAATGRHAATVAEDTAEKLDSGTIEHLTEGSSDGDGLTESTDKPADDSEDERDADADAPTKIKRRIDFSRLVAYAVLPGLALLLAAAAGYMRWQDSSDRIARIGSVESVAAAKDGTIAMLSYQPDTVEKDLGAARDRLTGTFKESYTHLTNDVVIPGAKQRHISAVATVPAAASVSATGRHAVALVFVNQTVVVGTDTPSATASSVRVTLDNVGDRWLISGFDPV